MRLTTAQALTRFLARQMVERDGEVQRMFAGCFGILGHGNLAGIGQALQQMGDDLRFIPARNEQAMVHAAIAYTRVKKRLQMYACTSSIGPGATNMVTGAATATINRLPVLLLPGDTFADRSVDPVLQQLECQSAGDVTVNDCFRPVSKYFDRVARPEQLMPALMNAMRVLTDPAETGAVTICMPQDVQAEAFDFDDRWFDERTWRVSRPAPEGLDEAIDLIRAAKRPLIVAGGGVIYSDAAGALSSLCTATGLPVAETQAGTGSLEWKHPSRLGAVGVTGNLAANRAAAEADVIIGIGTRWSDFTTASRTLFSGEAKFININVSGFDTSKMMCEARVIGDARTTIELVEGELQRDSWCVEPQWRDRCASHTREWRAERERVFSGHSLTQAAVIETVNRVSDGAGIVVCAAGSMPGDLHKLFDPADDQHYHVEYGYSCMGYEVAGGLGAAMAAPDRHVYVMVGDGSWLMMSSELVTAMQESVSMTVVVVDNHGYGSIGALSESLGSEGFGTRYRKRSGSGLLDGDVLELDFVAQAKGFGVPAVQVTSRESLELELKAASDSAGPRVIVVETDPAEKVPGYGAWWSVPVAEVSDMPAVQRARSSWEASSSSA